MGDFAELKKQLHALQAVNPAPVNHLSDVALQKFLATNHPPRIQPVRPRKAIDSNAPIHAAFVDNWDANSPNSPRNHAHQLTHICPEWLTLTTLDGALTEIEEANIEQFASLAPIVLMPTLSNLRGNDWQPEAVESLALAPLPKRQAFAHHLRARSRRSD